MTRIRERLSYANVMSTLAVFVALGGSSYAAVQLSKGSVRSKHIGKGQVKRSDIARNAVNSSKVADGTLARKDFDSDELAALVGPTGPAGAKGDTGPQGVAGPKGDTGGPGLSGLETVTATSASNSNTDKTQTATCPGDKKAVGGGYDLNITEPSFFHNVPPIIAVDNRPQGDNGWFVWAREENSWSGGTGLTNLWSITVHVKCASVAP